MPQKIKKLPVQNFLYIHYPNLDSSILSDKLFINNGIILCHLVITAHQINLIDKSFNFTIFLSSVSGYRFRKKEHNQLLYLLNKEANSFTNRDAEMRISFAANVEQTTATLNTSPFTFTEAHLSQENIARKRETQEKEAPQQKSLCTQFFKEDRRRGISGIFRKCWMHLASPFCFGVWALPKISSFTPRSGSTFLFF